MEEKALNIAVRFLLKVFDGDMIANATLVTAEAEGNIEPILHGLESTKKLCDKLIKSIKDESKEKDYKELYKRINSIRKHRCKELGDYITIKDN